MGGGPRPARGRGPPCHICVQPPALPGCDGRPMGEQEACHRDGLDRVRAPEGGRAQSCVAPGVPGVAPAQAEGARSQVVHSPTGPLLPVPSSPIMAREMGSLGSPLPGFCFRDPQTLVDALPPPAWMLLMTLMLTTLMCSEPGMPGTPGSGGGWCEQQVSPEWGGRCPTAQGTEWSRQGVLPLLGLQRPQQLCWVRWAGPGSWRPSRGRSI